jgi:hypothetical protein
MPPDGPTSAARTQSCADEKAQISEVTPAKSRMHQLSALPPAGGVDASAASKLTYTAFFMTSPKCKQTWRIYHSSQFLNSGPFVPNAGRPNILVVCNSSN